MVVMMMMRMMTSATRVGDLGDVLVKRWSHF